MEEDSFHCFVNKRRQASADSRGSEIKACFCKTVEDQTITQERRLCTTIETRSCPGSGVVVWCHAVRYTLGINLPLMCKTSCQEQGHILPKSERSVFRLSPPFKSFFLGVGGDN